MRKKLLSAAISALLPLSVAAETVTIPFGTTVYCETEEEVTSRKKETSEGDVVRARVWRDVRVGSEVVITAGTPVFVRVSKMQKARIAGRKGELELEALNVVAVDGRDIPLSGGYDKSGKGKVGLSVSLAAIVAWPLIFLKGKQAILGPGTIFDATILTPTDVEVASRASSTPRLAAPPPELTVSVLYDEMDPNAKIVELVLELRTTSGDVVNPSVVAVNGVTIPSIPIAVRGPTEGNTAKGAVEFKPLSKHFARGMNRIEVSVGDARAEVLIEIEL